MEKTSYFEGLIWCASLPCLGEVLDELDEDAVRGFDEGDFAGGADVEGREHELRAAVFELLGELVDARDRKGEVGETRGGRCGGGWGVGARVLKLNFYGFIAHEHARFSQHFELVEFLEAQDFGVVFDGCLKVRAFDSEVVELHCHGVRLLL